ncbi:MAG: preprotein translocase subunit SecE [Ruminococcaceae bacterium]|nr:preprotein translocase subunit SecE [Oscillospiraceae bacterium]
MATKNIIKVALVTLLTFALVICAMPFAFAVETEGLDSDSVADIATDTVAPEAADSTADTAVDTADDTSADTEEIAKDTAEAGDETGADTTETTGETSATEEEKGISTGTIVSIAIVAVIVVVAAVYCIKNREKVAKFFREVRSECKKVVWTPWKQVKKSTFVVVIIIIICVIVIGLLDYLFNTGIVSLGSLI